MFSNKLFYFSYKILHNAPCKKIMFLWNSTIFFQCCFMSETKVLMTVSDFSGFFSRNHFLEEGFIFQWRGGGIFSVGGLNFYVGGRGCFMGGASVLMGRGVETPIPPYGKPWTVQLNSKMSYLYENQSTIVNKNLKNFFHQYLPK